MSHRAPILTSARLRIVPLTLSHASDEYVRWMNDIEVFRHLDSGGDYNILKLNLFLKKVELDDIFFWAIHLKNDNKHIGNIKIDPINTKHRFAEYGIMMGDKTEWGKGYAKEASLQVLNYCFSRALNLRKVNLGVQAKNESAVELYKKIGFKQEGRFHNHVITSDGFDDILRMAIFNPYS